MRRLVYLFLCRRTRVGLTSFDRSDVWPDASCLFHRSTVCVPALNESPSEIPLQQPCCQSAGELKTSVALALCLCPHVALSCADQYWKELSSVDPSHPSMKPTLSTSSRIRTVRCSPHQPTSILCSGLYTLLIARRATATLVSPIETPNLPVMSDSHRRIASHGSIYLSRYEPGLQH
jgi:hypothetical protein